MTLSRRLAAEALGTAFLLAAIVGSGIMAARLSGANEGVALLVNTLVTGLALMTLILTFAPGSGAHFNPVVTLLEVWQGKMPWHDVPSYIAAQLIGACAGVAAVDVMFGLPVFSAATQVKSDWPLLWSEFIATFGLIGVIVGCSRRRPAATPFAVAAYIVAACWFTSSSSFANPAATLARAMSNTFTGIRPADVLGFVAAQIMGASCAAVVFDWMFPLAGKLDLQAESAAVADAGNEMAS
ncbi:MIP/aquaporin family protein [Collimonas pratensis]|uniref:Major intrinsic family protein n=1 Tax=Collimonas pratensis TaxID=279113 RepID=A0ABN4MDJ8_9BURK|nr:MIP/aquaporin family protein [Collimonas pratensis]AMP15883.1 major intrinsic family protein [Collimonas pratensis]